MQEEPLSGQGQHSEANRTAWSFRAYDAWHRLEGTPSDAAEAIRRDPRVPLRQYSAYLGNVRGKRIANLLGSHGKRAVALSLLGAQVTVVDISEENRRYVLEVAGVAGAALDYVVSDALK